ncbi:MAG: LysM peptidoglycan-binding domain-containing M23 family metallopeptidase [Rickettsia endosymbiont of Bryobia graminum]|nr:LysM peptidoglycan-binding domain-containing M23 family metallopeptidase [Rickettsia endosymbiont of Bryobia graminum]
MKINQIFLFFIAFIMFGCTGQFPAPVEYNHGKNYTKKTSKTNLSDKNFRKRDISSENDEDRIIRKQLDQKEQDFDRPDGYLVERQGEEIKREENQDNILSVPEIKPDNSKLIYHEVQPGETLVSIANKYNQTSEELGKLNDLTPPYTLSEAQIVKIRVSTELLNKKNKESNLKENSIVTPTPRTAKFAKPVEGKVVSKFGQQAPEGKNAGVNIFANKGSKVTSVGAGKVIFSGNNKKFGNLVIIKLDEGDLYAAYAHLEDLIVQKGSTVSKGQMIGHVGQTGDVKSPQLHFAIRKGKTAVDPLTYLNDQ